MSKEKATTKLEERPPVVVVMGHIDHGKSTLLDFIRQSNVAEGEPGGITQHLGAYEIDYQKKKGGVKKITFIDTPGHAAFSAMRETSSSIADLAVLVVSAEDGVKAQTLEALAVILEKKLPYLVAINKIDRPNANLPKTKQELAENGVLLEGYGGAVPVAEISAKTGAGVPELLELILLIAELEELKTDPKAPASGFVLEAHLNPKVGILSTVIVKQGSLKVGEYLTVGKECFKIKRLHNFLGQAIGEAIAGMPVEVAGFNQLPAYGAPFHSFASKTLAEKCCEECQVTTKKPVEQVKANATSDDNQNLLFIPISLKADVLGTLSALEREVARLGSNQIKLQLIAKGIGRITDNDIKLASSSREAIVIGFNVGIDRSAEELAEKYGLTVETFDIIYKLSEWLEALISKRTPKIITETPLGRAKVLKIFSTEKDRQVLGGVVTEGQAMLGKTFRIWRREINLGKGKVLELESQKLKIKQVEKDKMFGALTEAKVDIAVGDMLEFYDLVES